MPRQRTDAGATQARYVKRSPERMPRMVTPGGVDLGPALKPTDIFIRLRHALQLEDGEIIDALREGAARLAGHDCHPELTAAELDEAIAASAAVTPSRIIAWRRRGREMTWLELRVFLLGLGDVA